MAAPAPQVHHPNLFDFNTIYNDNFRYSLPRGVLEGFLSGKAFDHKTEYTREELEKVKADIDAIYREIMAAHPIQTPIMVMTAGAPGAGKTTLLLQDLEKKERKYAYVDPDHCLQNLKRTYRVDVGDAPTPEGLKAAYTKWRPASNAAAQILLAHLIQRKCGIYFGTTATSPQTSLFLDFLTKQGYFIRVLHLTAPDNVRWASIQERDRTFVQTTEQDIRDKGVLLPQRIADTFLKYAGILEFYYRDAVGANAQLVAVRAREISQDREQLRIKNRALYEQVRAIHNTAVESLNRLDLKWEGTVESNIEIVDDRK
jgi:hypothetical protein